jgi:hypothetical protein
LARGLRHFSPEVAMNGAGTTQGHVGASDARARSHWHPEVLGPVGTTCRAPTYGMRRPNGSSEMALAPDEHVHGVDAVLGVALAVPGGDGRLSQPLALVGGPGEEPMAPRRGSPARAKPGQCRDALVSGSGAGRGPTDRPSESAAQRVACSRNGRRAAARVAATAAEVAVGWSQRRTRSPRVRTDGGHDERHDERHDDQHDDGTSA